MKHILFLFVLLIVPTSFSQEKPKATKIDEFGTVTCEDLLARIDHFNLQLQNNPSAVGVAVIDSPKNGKDRSPYYRLLIQKTFQRNGYPYDRLRFYRRRTPELGGSLWILQPGADEPFSDGEPWSDASLDLSRPFVWDTYEDDGVCPTFAPGVYAELLKKHSDLRGHIVVNEDTRHRALASGNHWIKELTQRWGIPRNRLRLFIGKRNTVWFSTEFWIVPIKRR